MIIGERIQERILACGTTQAALGRRVRLSQSTINGLIRGDQTSTTKLHLIARELKTTPAYLTGETDDPESEVPTDDLSGEERQMVELLRTLNSTDRKAVEQLVKSLSGSGKSRPPTIHDPRSDYRAET